MSGFILVSSDSEQPSTAGSLHTLALDIQVTELGGPTATSVHPGSRKAGRPLCSDRIRLGREIKREESGMFVLHLLRSSQCSKRFAVETAL